MRECEIELEGIYLMAAKALKTPYSQIWLQAAIFKTANASNLIAKALQIVKRDWPKRLSPQESLK